jgi:hydroxymethylglutaryl-CoA synthase
MVTANGAEVGDPYQATSAVAAVVRKRPEFRDLLAQKMNLGASAVRDLGNLYSAALPVWLAAGFEEAAERDLDITDRAMVAVGYGSGDAAEAIPIKPAVGWKEAASRIGLARALSNTVDLTREQYEALHDGRDVPGLNYAPSSEFVITHVGERYDASFQDLGIEYYKYVG